MSAVYQAMSISNKYLLLPLQFTLAIHMFFKSRHSKSYNFSHKTVLLFWFFLGGGGYYFIVKYTLFILYSEGKHTLFGGKSFFILKITSGNTDLVDCNSGHIDHFIMLKYIVE